MSLETVELVNLLREVAMRLSTTLQDKLVCQAESLVAQAATGVKSQIDEVDTLIFQHRVSLNIERENLMRYFKAANDHGCTLQQQTIRDLDAQLNRLDDYAIDLARRCYEAYAQSRRKAA